MAKRITTTNTDTSMEIHSAMIAKICGIRFIKESTLSWVDIYSMGNEAGDDVLIEQVESEIISTPSELGMFAYGWFIKNVEIAK